MSIYGLITFPTSHAPTSDYERIKGALGPPDGHHSYKLNCTLFTGRGDPNPDVGNISDIYFDLDGSRIFAKLGPAQWSYWEMHKLAMDDMAYPVIEYPFNSRLHLWCKEKMGVQWFSRDNMKTQRHRRKGEVVDVTDAIQLTMNFLDDPKKINARGKKRKQEELDPPMMPSSSNGPSMEFDMVTSPTPIPSNALDIPPDVPMDIPSLSPEVSMDIPPRPAGRERLTLKLPPLKQKPQEGVQSSVTEYAYKLLRSLPDAFLNAKKFPKASIVTWVNGMRTVLPGGPKWGVNAVSRIRLYKPLGIDKSPKRTQRPFDIWR
jgi:hypothetical protein